MMVQQTVKGILLSEYPSSMQEIKQLIIQGEIEMALNILEQKLPSSFQHRVSQLQIRYHALQRDMNNGVFSSDDIRRERNQITTAMLDLGDAISTPQQTTPAQPSPRQPSGNSPKKVFFSYSKPDRAYLDQLLKHMAVLRYQNKIDTLNDQEILPGEEWNAAARQQLLEADIILLLISSDYLATRHIWEVDISEAMARHENGTARVIPIYIRPANWENTPFSKLSGLPNTGTSVSEYPQQDLAWQEVVNGIIRVL